MKKISFETIAGVILVTLLNPQMGSRLSVKLIKKILKEQEIKNSITRQSLGVILNRLKKDGLIESPHWGQWRLSKTGKSFVNRHLQKEQIYNNFRIKYGGDRDTIIIFDIPEILRKKRALLRIELVALGFEPLQKSVWIGGSQLPREFIRFLKDNSIFQYLHIFTIKKYGTISKK